MANTQDVLGGVADAIRHVIGEDWILDETIELKTSFADDLELESIEFVALAERLQETYGSDLNFVSTLWNLSKVSFEWRSPHAFHISKWSSGLRCL